MIALREELRGLGLAELIERAHKERVDGTKLDQTIHHLRGDAPKPEIVELILQARQNQLELSRTVGPWRVEITVYVEPVLLVHCRMPSSSTWHMSAHMSIRMYIRMRARMPIRLHVHTSADMCVCMPIHMSARVSAHMSTYMPVHRPGHLVTTQSAARRMGELVGADGGPRLGRGQVR